MLFDSEKNPGSFFSQEKRNFCVDPDENVESSRTLAYDYVHM
ncbi:hypothetical protein KP78_37020 [Jeotgalibacillus soli]|uniref:Uncharacterized protein n=1 Tax=Jeotgalibacillus soli TaxID=889306 RepID=A0A0C2VIP9_9BACL|nr:hypothetical protein KP78_37020 [Jeotgalibacillus soli]